MAVQNTRNQSNNKILILLILAVVAVLGTGAFFLLGSGNNEAIQKATRSRPEGQIAIPIIRQDINLGGRITGKVIGIQYVAPENVPQDAVIAPANFIGRLAIRPLKAGDYIKQGDFSAEGARPGLSGVTTTGKRVIALPATAFPENEAVFAGDRIDILSIGRITDQPSTPGPRQKSAVEKALGGSGPGAATSRRKAANAATPAIASTSATLIAENVEVLAKNQKNIVLQMEPQDAHVTVLAVASGATLRAVFRPFNDETRLTPTPKIKVTTRLPKPSRDPDLITVFNGSDITNARPISERYRSDSENDQVYTPEDYQSDESIEPYIQYVN